MQSEINLKISIKHTHNEIFTCTKKKCM